MNRTSGLKARVFGNAGWMMTENLIRLLFNLFVGVWVARFLGPQQYGLLSYAIAVLAFLSPIADAGLSGVVTRDVIADREKEHEILGTAFGIRFIGGVVKLLIAVLFVAVLRPDESLVLWMVVWIGIGQSFNAFKVLDFWFQSHLESRYVTVARLISTIAANTAKVILILNSAPVVYFAIAFASDYALLELSLLLSYKLKREKLSKWKFTVNRAGRYLKTGFPLILSSVASVLNLKVDQIMLAMFSTDYQVGIYAAAVRLSEAWYIIPVSIAASAFPVLIKQKKENPLVYERTLQHLYDILALIGIAAALFVTIFGSKIILLLLGNDYKASIPVLLIHIWAGVFMSTRAVLSKWILTENLLIFSLLTHGLGAVINIILNLILIPEMAGVGAAYATLISYATSSYIALMFHRKGWKALINITLALISPVRYAVKLLGFIRRRFVG